MDLHINMHASIETKMLLVHALHHCMVKLECMIWALRNNTFKLM